MVRALTALVLALALALALAPRAGAQAPATARPFTPDDVLRFVEMSEPRISPEGDWVAYTVSSADTALDQNHQAIWMTSWDGMRTVRLTNSKQGKSTPSWSPDGRWLRFLSTRDDEHTQLWLLDRRGGEGRKV